MNSKTAAAENLIQEMSRLRDGLLSQAAAVQQCNGNTTAITNQFATIIDGIRSVRAFYTNVLSTAYIFKIMKVK